MTYEEALSYIHSVRYKEGVPGVERERALLERLGSPQKKLKFVHIAGTNGKGSTAAMLAAILKEAGYRVGLYTSPFLMRFNERMMVNGEEISDEALAEVTEFVRPHAMEMRLTEFELVTAIAMEYFARQRCDIVCLEVGVGGLWDPTNVIDCPEAAVITNIGLDHTELLGDTLEKIAENKAGIIKAGCRVAAYRSGPRVEKVLARVCAEKGAALYFPDFEAIVPQKDDFSGQIFDYRGYPRVELPLLGAHQLKNTAVVLTAVEALRDGGWQIPEAAVRAGIRTVRWPCRFELLRENPAFIVDGGHNPQCLEALAGNVETYLGGMEIVALTGVMADKDYTDMYATMAPLVSRFVTVTPDNPRSMSGGELAAFLEPFGRPATACPSVAEGIQTAMAQAGENGAVLVFGSLYLAGEVRNLVTQNF